MESDKYICKETNYSHDSVLTKRFVVKHTVESCDVFLVGVPQMFDRERQGEI
jgi:hypothetical protein